MSGLRLNARSTKLRATPKTELKARITAKFNNLNKKTTGNACRRFRNLMASLGNLGRVQTIRWWKQKWRLPQLQLTLSKILNRIEESSKTFNRLLFFSIIFFFNSISLSLIYYYFLWLCYFSVVILFILTALYNNIIWVRGEVAPKVMHSNYFHDNYIYREHKKTIVFFTYKKLFSSHIQRGSPRGVMVKALVCGIVVREFVLQSRYHVHFRANTLGKGMNPLILPAIG